ncbi:hypothetical protein UlMin_034911 [Ulmus minor]
MLSHFKIGLFCSSKRQSQYGFNKVSLIISQAQVNEDTTMKRFKPRARGRSYPIKILTCHISIILKDIDLASKYLNENYYIL